MIFFKVIGTLQTLHMSFYSTSSKNAAI
jgi:hypothetical protein